MNFIQSTWVKELIPLANKSESRDLERWENKRPRRMVEVEGVEMGEGVAGFVGPLVRKEVGKGSGAGWRRGNC
jgi:hypothetical protein